MILQANKQKAGQLRPLKLPAAGLWLWEVIVEHKLLRSQTFPLCGPANMQKVIKYSNVLKVLRCGPVVYQRQVLCEQVKPVCKALTYYPKQHAVSLYLMIMSKCPDYKVSKPFSPLQKRSRSSYQPVFLDWISSNQFWVRLETRWGLDLNPRASWGLPRVWTNVYRSASSASSVMLNGQAEANGRMLKLHSQIESVTLSSSTPPPSPLQVRQRTGQTIQPANS